MKNHKQNLSLLSASLVVGLLSGCGGGGGTTDPTTDTTYTIGGSVSGLAGSGLVLQNNGGDDLSISADGNFTFNTAIDDTNDYAVTVSTAPSNLAQTCSVSNGAGTLAGANITDVSVACVDDVSPTLSNTTPVNDATNVERNATFSATFNEDMIASTVNGTNITLSDGSNVAGAVSFDTNTNIATFTPTNELALLRNYTANLNTSITDLSGNALANTNVIFTTRDGVWSTETKLENAINDSSNPSVAVNSAGEGLIVWVKNDGEFNNIVASSYSGGVFGSPVVIETEDLGNAIEPKIAMDSNGNGFAIWHQYDGSQRNNIWINRFDASTKSWGTAETIESNTGNALDTDIAIDVNGNAFAIWSQRDTAQYNIWVNRYDAVTDSWGTPEKIETEDFGDAFEAKIAFDGNGNAIAIWRQLNTVYSIWSNRYNVSTGTWVTAELIETDDTGYTAHTAQLAVSKNGNAMAVWAQDFSTGVERATANRYDITTGSWGTAEIIDTNPTDHSYNPEVAIDAEGNATVVWYDANDAGNNYYIRAKSYSVEIGWGGVVNVEDTTVNSVEYPRIVMDESGNAISVWSSLDAVGNYYSVYSSRLVVGSGWSTPTLLESGTLTVAIEEVALGLGSNGHAIVAYPQEVGVSVNVMANLFE